MLSGCRSAGPVIPPIQIVTRASPASTATPTPTKLPRLTSTLVFGGPSLNIGREVMDACETRKQTLAMRSSEIPDWSSLSLDTCYNLRFDLTSGGPEYQGTAVITYTNSTPHPLADLVLRVYPNAKVIYGGNLEILSIRLDGGELEFQNDLPDGTVVRLIIPESIPPGKTVTLDLEFSGELPVDFGGDQTYGIFNYSSRGPVLMLANAYPILAERQGDEWRVDPVQGFGDAVLSHTSLYKVVVAVPDSWQVATTGAEVSSSITAGVTIHEFVSGPAREFMLAASPAFQYRERTTDGITIRHWGLDDTKSAWDEALAAAADSMTLFNQKFGPYPFNELDMIAAPLNNAAGVEYPGVILIGEKLYPGSPPPRRLSNVVAHEVAHQWWYSLVGSDVLLHPWQDEALATFSSQLYEQVEDPAYYNGAETYYRQTVTEVEADLGNQKIDQAASSFAGKPGAYGVVEYFKGYLFFEELRKEIGETVFFEALQEYFTGFTYLIAQPGDLLNSFEIACSCNLHDFYASWGVE